MFERMFQQKMKEAIEGRLVIDDIEPNVLKELICFIYTGKFTEKEIPEGMFTDLFKSADKYGMDGLKVKCLKQIIKTVTKDNALEVYGLGDTYNEPSLMAAALQILKRLGCADNFLNQVSS